MDVLANLFCSRTRAGILTCLFGAAPQRLHVRALVRESGCSLGAVQQDLRNLVALGLIRSERDGNRLYYSAEASHPLYHGLREIVARTTGIYAVLADCLGSSGIRFAYVFGSVASGQAKASSDVDLMVIGSVGLRELVARLVPAGERLGREINPHVMSEDEYFKRCKEGEHFISTVIGAERRVIVGDEHELRGVEKQRKAQGAPHVAPRNRESVRHRKT
jgi:predicted nucleotidyltransferase